MLPARALAAAAFLAMGVATSLPPSASCAAEVRRPKLQDPAALEAASLLVFTPDMSAAYIQSRIDEVAAPFRDIDHHFTDARLALLFYPGRYANLTIPVGYYVQVIGLGRKPSDVVFVGDGGAGPGVVCHASSEEPGVGSLDTFWRSAENFRQEGDLLWAVSQAAPLRSVEVGGRLLLHDDHKYASGGFASGLDVAGPTDFGSQQQFFLRQSRFGEAPAGGGWSFVFSGCEGAEASDHATYAPDPAAGKPLREVLRETALVAEKPFLAAGDPSAPVELVVPLLQSGRVGLPDGDAVRVVSDATFVGPGGGSEALGTFGEDDLGPLLAAGRDVVLLPGVYRLAAPLSFGRSGQVLLGLGLATLIAPPAGPCISVGAALDDVRIAGVTLQAGRPDAYEGSALLVVGEPGKGGASPSGGASAVLSDVYCRVGGPDQDRGVSVETMVVLHADRVVLDNVWLWVADHAAKADDDAPETQNADYYLTQNGDYRCDHGLVVHGSGVHAYGLAVEHTYGAQVLWKGASGRVAFFQSELPYWVNAYAGAGFVVDDAARDFQAWGLGVYSNFRSFFVAARTAVEAPEHASLRSVFSRYLDSYGGITSLLNDDGKMVLDGANGEYDRLKWILSTRDQ